MTTLALQAPPLRNKYAVVAWVALRQCLNERANLIARGAFYILVLFIFARVWRAVLGSAGTDQVWYLAVSEWIALSVPRVYAEIERDVRSGDVACALTRPTSYLGVRLAEAAGELLLSLWVLGVVGTLAAFALTGSLPADSRGLLPAVVLGLLSSVLWLLCSALIGLLAFWLRDVSPLYWLWQKAAFLLGGLLVPLDFYPKWLRLVALWSPFSAMINGPARMVLDFQPALAALLCIKLGASIVLAWTLLDMVYRRALGAIAIDGG
jgi:ABC-2 type transport system permease protein